MNITFQHVFLPSAASTNQYGMQLIELGIATNAMVVITPNQTAGRGLDKNIWESEPGKNLTFSILMKAPALPARSQFMLNKATSLAVKDFVQNRYKSGNVSVKWPNDVYVKNKKIAGILINNIIIGKTIEWTVIGIGININQEKFESDAPNPVSLKMLIGQDSDLESCLNDFIGIFNKWWSLLEYANWPEIDKFYLQSLYRFGEMAKFKYKSNSIEAQIVGTNEYGHLILRKADGEIIVCEMKEIVFSGIH